MHDESQVIIKSTIDLVLCLHVSNCHMHDESKIVIKSIIDYVLRLHVSNCQCR